MDTWVRAVCKAKYEDDEGEEQEVELIHWLTALTDSQLNALGGVDGGQTGVLETVQEAADYAGVDPATIDVWLESGLVITPEGHFIPANLDLFVEAGGEPSPEELAQQRFDVSMDFEEDPAADWQEEGALDPEMDTGGDAGMQGPRRRER
jgi:hypothetical protein